MKFFNRVIRKLFYLAVPEFYDIALRYLMNLEENVVKGKPIKIYPKYRLRNVNIGDYSYISSNSNILNTKIGKFCSIGPNFVCGWGIHPLDGISTSPVFYSTKKQVGVTFSSVDKIEESKNILIGNDVFIGMNVTILDGIIIEDGAVIAAGSVVTKDVKAYSVVGGVPARHIKYRFEEKDIESLLKIKWWDYEKDGLMFVEKNFFEIESFIKERIDSQI